MGCSTSADIPQPPANIEDFLRNIRPLDLIVFRGSDLVSDSIRALEKFECGSDEISHVEVAMTREWCESIRCNADSDKLFSWGSTMSGSLSDGVPSAETGRSFFGVQFRCLEDLVVSYTRNPLANVGVARLFDNPTVQGENESSLAYGIRSALLKKKIAEAYHKYNGHQYNAGVLSLGGALFPQLRAARNASDLLFAGANPGWMFCSEFAAALYHHVGIIADGETPFDSRNVLPVDFLGYERDADGLTTPICEPKPLWIKPLH